MRGKIVFAGLILALSAAGVSAQGKQAVPTTDDMYCSGLISSEAVPRDTFLITGEGSNYKVTFQQGDYVYINKGSSQGAKVGDVYSVVRAVWDPTEIEWAKWQFSILRKLGTMWEDEGRLRVVVAQPDVSIAQVENACNYIQRDDIVLPFAERPAPPLKSKELFDRFAPPSGKPTAMVITGKRFGILMGTNDTIYVNLGSSQGVKVGDYFRIFRYQGTQHEVAYQTPRFAFDADSSIKVYGRAYGYGSVPQRYKWDNVPREVVGEGVVVRTGPNASTVLVTHTVSEFYAGDYVEVE
ncbi:MAG: hypothetical protein WBP79_12855 [Candidatus Acidiferrales bacterium]